MKYNLSAVVLFIFTSCHAQPDNDRSSRHVGGNCEGCEAIFEYGDRKLNPVDTLPGFSTNEPKLLVTGIVYEQDGTSPAKNVIVYIYHTNREGIYETKGDEQGWARRHGFIRGWAKTGSDGRYAFYTFRPAAYPNERAPEHIHITVKEEDVNEYYIDEYLFNDDPLVTDAVRSSQPGRGGSGIVQPRIENGMLTVRRDIILGLNIPDY